MYSVRLKMNVRVGLLLLLFLAYHLAFSVSLDVNSLTKVRKALASILHPSKCTIILFNMDYLTIQVIVLAISIPLVH